MAVRLYLRAVFGAELNYYLEIYRSEEGKGCDGKLGLSPRFRRAPAPETTGRNAAYRGEAGIFQFHQAMVLVRGALSRVAAEKTVSARKGSP